MEYRSWCRIQFYPEHFGDYTCTLQVPFLGRSRRFTFMVVPGYHTTWQSVSVEVRKDA